MNNERIGPGKVDKDKMIITQQVIHNIMEIVELYPQYSISQHLNTILRRKNSKKESFFWSNEELLKRIEQHKTELEGEDLMNITDDE